MPRRDPVFLAWAAGLGLAALIYVVGPDRFLFRLEDWIHVMAWRLTETLADLSATAIDLMRALSVGLYVTFLALAFALGRRGGRSRLAVVVVSILFLILVQDADPTGPSRWLAALILSGIGAAVMTGRLRQARTLARS